MKHDITLTQLYLFKSLKLESQIIESTIIAQLAL